MSIKYVVNTKLQCCDWFYPITVLDNSTHSSAQASMQVGFVVNGKEHLHVSKLLRAWERLDSIKYFLCSYEAIIKYQYYKTPMHAVRRVVI